MAKSSTMLPLGSPVPAFALPDTVSGRLVRDTDFGGRPLLVLFVCNHCPYVVHVRPGLLRLARDYAGRVDLVAINSNSVLTHPQDGPQAMRALAEGEEWDFPFLFDETQEVAKAFQAACTPEFYLFGADRKLQYRGQFDDARPSLPTPVTGRDLRAALDQVLQGRAPSADQRPSIGCGIKWHPGQEPAYAR